MRWEKAGKGGLEPPLHAYFKKLRRDAKKQKLEFVGNYEEQGSVFAYRIQRPVPARGQLRDVGTRRVFLEVAGPHRGLNPLFKDLARSLESVESDPRWSLYGLDLTLPPRFRVNKAELLSGRTTLQMRIPGVLGAELVAERWGLGRELLSKHDLADWAKARLGWRRFRGTQSDFGHEFRARTRVALVHFDEPRNQILLLRGSSIRAEWRPQWDWLTSLRG